MYVCAGPAKEEEEKKVKSKQRSSRWHDGLPAGLSRTPKKRGAKKRGGKPKKKKNKREEGKMNCLWNSPPIINREREQSGQFSLSFSFSPLLAGHHAVLYIARQKRSTYRWKSIFPLFMETKREREKSPCDLSLCLHCGLSCSVKRGFHRAEKRPSIS